MTLPERERLLRERLRIPLDARRVLIFSESSHWDTNWLRTSLEYFERRLRPIFNAVIKALEEDPERVYCIESVFFLKLFWEHHPEARDRLVRLIERRQLRLLSSSFTTPDTLLPHSEAILRDFHLGQEWLRANGLNFTPTTAYFPDNFGHSPHLPSLMRAVGVDSVAVTRIDGMYFVGADYRMPSAFPQKGSTAETLQRELRTLDFVWRDDDGAEVLCHWNAFTYFQGDMLAHLGITRWNGWTVGIPWRTSRHIARRVNGFVQQLEPLARTPYMLCPIGMDFVDPIRDPRTLLDRYNRERYPVTGTWTLLAGMDDYFELVGCHRDLLPVLAVDPNPYWMGFYASRPTIKQRPMRIARTLVLAEHLSALAPHDPVLESHLRDAWMNVVLINHHDAITGTSPDHVWHREQQVWLDTAEKAAHEALSMASGGASLATRKDAPDAIPTTLHSGEREGVRWSSEGELVQVHTANRVLTFSRARGGCLVSLVQDGEEVLDGVALDLVAHSDHGGLWRLGHEFRGGRFEEIDRISRRPARLEILEEPEGITLVIDADLLGKPFKRTVILRADEPMLRFAIAGAAGRRVTVTCRCDLALGETRLEMDTVGGTIERPQERLFRPTFWPVPSLLSLRGLSQAVHAAFETPTAVAYSPPGTLEWIVARNATREQAFRFLPVLAHPIGGTTDESQEHHVALFVTEAKASASSLRTLVGHAWLSAEHRPLRVHADSIVRCDDPTVQVVAAKRADVGEGIIVRLAKEHCDPASVRVWLTKEPIVAAARCTAREHDVAPLAIEDGSAIVELHSRITTVRLVRGETAPFAKPLEQGTSVAAV